MKSEAAALLLLVACAPITSEPRPSTSTLPTTTAPTVASSIPSTTEPTRSATTEPAGPLRPAWLGTRPLPLRPDGFGQVLPTPAELVDRQLPTLDVLAPPESDVFVWSAGSVPPEVAVRSTWQTSCPVGLEELSYLTVSFFGFDGRYHTGEAIVNALVADDLVEVFRRLHELRFPLEEMRVLRLEELDAPPTGDGNLTGVYECRPATGGSSWSNHAYGLAADLNPFHNPYVKGDLVLPELASAYVDRSRSKPGMIVAEVVEAFAGMGWGWGGDWQTMKDYMHFSHNGR